MAPTVLVVDDDDSIRLLVTRLFSRNGYSVSSAKDGAEAVEQLTTAEFDLLVIDLMMPRLDGFGVLEYLNNHSRTPRIIVMTAAAPAIVNRLPVGRIWKVITKPFDLSVMSEAAEAALNSEPEVA